MRRGPARPLAALGACAVVIMVAAPACRDATEVSVVVTTDVKCPDVKGTSLTVGNLADVDERPITTATTACADGRIGELVVVPSGADDETVAVRVVLGFGRDPAECVPPAYGPGCIVARRALRYIPHEHLTLPIFMSAVCSGVACGATETCVGGNCVPATIPDPSACASPEGCGEGSLGQPSDAGATAPTASASGQPAPPPPPPPPADAAAPCAVGAVCDVVTSTTVVDVAATATSLFWLDSAGKVMTSTLDGAGARAIVTGEASPLSGIEADGSFVFWTAGGKVRRAGVDGASPTTLGNLQGGCLKWSTPSTDLLAAAPAAGAIYLLTLSNGALSSAQQVIGGAVDPFGVAGQYPNELYTNRSEGLVRRAVPGGNISAVLAQNQSTPTCMASDGTSMYWANGGSGELVKAPLGGSPTQALVTGQTGIAGVALSGSYVYWSYAGGVRKRTK